MEKVAHRFWHLWQGSLLQWILARHNTWVYKVYCWLNQLLIVLCTHCSYLGEHRGQGTLSWEAPRRPCSPPLSRSPISVSHPGHITSCKDHPMALNFNLKEHANSNRAAVTWMVPPSVLRKIGFTLAWASTCTSSASVQEECWKLTNIFPSVIFWIILHNSTWIILHMNWSTSSPSSKAGLLKCLSWIGFHQVWLWFGLYLHTGHFYNFNNFWHELTCILGISTSPFHSWAWDRTPDRSTAREILKKWKARNQINPIARGKDTLNIAWKSHLYMAAVVASCRKTNPLESQRTPKAHLCYNMIIISPFLQPS